MNTPKYKLLSLIVSALIGGSASANPIFKGGQDGGGSPVDSAPEPGPNGRILQSYGAIRNTAEIAAQDLIKGCLKMPVYQTGAATFEGVEELKFTLLSDGNTFAFGKCVFKVLSGNRP